MEANPSQQPAPACECKNLDIGLLILRIGIGLAFLGHGIPKLVAGPPVWEKLGGAMALLGVTWAPDFWGFMAAFAEAAGGLSLILGLLLRPFLIMLLFEMLLASYMHLHMGQGFNAASNALQMVVVFAALLVTGAGRYSLGQAAGCLRERWFR